MPKPVETPLVPAERTELSVPAVLAPGRVPVAHARHDSLVEILWRQRRIVLYSAGLGILLELLYLLFATPLYTSTSRLYVRRGGSSLLTEQHMQQGSSDDDSFLFTQKEVIGSTPVVALTLSSPGIHDLRTFKGESSPFDYLKKNISVDVGKKDELVSVAFDSPYPAEASTIVSAVVKSYISFETDQRQRAAEDATATLTADKAKWEGELSEKTDALLKFRKTHGIVGTGPNQSGEAEQRLHAISDALMNARVETGAARGRYQQLADQLDANPAMAKKVHDAEQTESLISSPEDAASIRQELVLAQAHVRELERQYMPGHPAVRAAQQRVDQLAVEQAVSLKEQLKQAESKQAELQKQYDQEQSEAINQNAYAAEDARMQADIARLEKLVDSVDSRVRELNLTSDDAAVSISVLETAHTEDKPTKPQKGRTLGLALAAGLMCGAGLGAMRDRYDRRLHSADDVRSILGLDVLSQFPAMSPELSPTDRAQQAHLSPESELAEACRTLRTAILFHEETVPTTIVVTSPSAGDGRTTVASNLAISLAEAGKHVLLLDGDLRSPMQDWVFGLDKNTGLVGALNADELMAIDRLPGIQHTGVHNLDVLPAGPIGADPLRILNSPPFAELLEKLADAYDHVVIDSPATATGPDARILGAVCDACLVVLREGKHNQRLAEQARGALASVGANVLGVVLNRIPPSGRMDGGRALVRKSGDLTRRLGSTPRDSGRLASFAPLPPGT